MDPVRRPVIPAPDQKGFPRARRPGDGFTGPAVETGSPSGGF